MVDVPHIVALVPHAQPSIRRRPLERVRDRRTPAHAAHMPMVTISGPNRHDVLMATSARITQSQLLTPESAGTGVGSRGSKMRDTCSLHSLSGLLAALRLGPRLCRMPMVRRAGSIGGPRRAVLRSPRRRADATGPLRAPSSHRPPVHRDGHTTEAVQAGIHDEHKALGHAVGDVPRQPEMTFAGSTKME
jgi:hypothetical protein